MGKRTRTARLTCTFDGCNEVGWMDYDNQRDYADVTRRRSTWRCVRHHKDGRDVPTPDVPLVEVLTVVEKEHGTFWADSERVGSGFVHGPGFRAFAKDYPVGTTLTITAALEVPQYERALPRPNIEAEASPNAASDASGGE